MQPAPQPASAAPASKNFHDEKPTDNRFLQELYQMRALTLKSIVLQFRQYKTNICTVLLPILCLLFIFALQLVINIIISRVRQSEVSVPSVPVQHADVHTFALSRNNLTYTMPHAFLMMYDSDSIRSAFGTANANGTSSGMLRGPCGKFGSPALCSPFPLSPALRFNYSRLVAGTNQKTGEWVISPYYSERKTPFDVNIEIADNIAGFGQVEALDVIGTYQIHEWNLSQTTAASVKYTIQHDNLTQTQYCRTISGLSFGGDCRQIIPSGMVNFLHNLIAFEVTGNTFISTLVAQMPYTTGQISFNIADIMGTFFYPLILLLPLPVFMYTLVLEKADKLKEMMKLMGMKTRNYFCITFMFQYGIYAITAIEFVVICVILRFRFMIGTSPFLMLIALVGWGLNLISFAFFLSTFLRDKMAAVVVGYFLVLFGPICGVILEGNVFQVGNWAFKPLLLVFPLSLTHFTYAAATNCSRFQCLTNRALLTSAEIQASLLSFYVNAILYLILGLYFDQVLPQPWGIRKDILFPISWIWKGACSRRAYDQKNADKLALANDADLDKDVLEEKRNILDGKATPDNSGVLLLNLKKSYGSKHAVKGVHLSISKQECFGLLGQNGAGKTTTISMLCGLFGPSAGTAYVNGYDIRTQMDQIHLSMGLCPQFDILFDDLTCREHLLFYARIKGIPPSQEKAHVERLLDMVGLSQKQLGRSPLSSALSGGMKRRLSIAISLVGNPAIVMLDEPTTGLDPTSKRHLWDVILRAKKDRCIILTTHSMEESEALCDRIGIMHLGQLRCLGSSLHLKSRFGGGYYINVNYDAANREKAKLYLQHRLPQATIISEFAGKATFVVPTQALKVSKFFREMELAKQSGESGWKTFSLNMTTLEDVFLTLVEETKSNKTAAPQPQQPQPTDTLVNTASANTLQVV